MPTTDTLDTKTDRAHPMPKPMKRLTVPVIAKHKSDGPLLMGFDERAWEDAGLGGA